MLSYTFGTAVLAGAALVSSAVVDNVVRSSDVEVLQERDSSVLCSKSLATSHNNDVLFNIGVSVGHDTDDVAALGAAFVLECIRCETWGSVVVSTTGASSIASTNILTDVEAFLANPVDVITEASNLELSISLEDIGGYFEFDIFAEESVTYTYNLFTSEIVSAIAINDALSIGLVVYLDLVFSLSAEIDLEAGFEFSFPEGASIIIDPLEGIIKDSNFAGSSINNLPITVTSGAATFQAAIRVRCEAGTSIELLGTEIDFALSVYADVLEYEAVFSKISEIDVLVTECFDIAIGAYAVAVAEIDYLSFGIAPTAVVTIFDYAIPSYSTSYATATSSAAAVSGSAVSVTQYTTSTVYATSTYTSGGVVVTDTVVDYTTVCPVTATEASSAPSVTQYTTSTVYATSTYTSSGVVVTDTVVDYTTVCPVTATETGSAGQATSTSGSFSSLPFYSNGTSKTSGSGQATTSSGSLTTSTVYTTATTVVGSCQTPAIHCPASLSTDVTVTNTKVLYTTVCPVGEAQPTTLPASAQATTTTGASGATSAHPSVTGTITLTSCDSTSTIYVTSASPISYTYASSALVNATTTGASGVKSTGTPSGVKATATGSGYASPSGSGPKNVGTGSGYAHPTAPYGTGYASGSGYAVPSGSSTKKVGSASGYSASSSPVASSEGVSTSPVSEYTSVATKTATTVPVSEYTSEQTSVATSVATQGVSTGLVSVYTASSEGISTATSEYATPSSPAGISYVGGSGSSTIIVASTATIVPVAYGGTTISKSSTQTLQVSYASQNASAATGTATGEACLPTVTVTAAVLTVTVTETATSALTTPLVIATGYPSKSTTNTTVSPVSVPSSISMAVLPSGSGYPVKSMNSSAAAVVPYPSGTGASVIYYPSGTGKASSSMVAPTRTPVVSTTGSATGSSSAASSSAVEFTGAAGKKSVGGLVAVAAGVLGLLVL